MTSGETNDDDLYLNRKYPVVSFRTNPESRDLLRATSTAAGESMGEYIRKAIAQRMATEQLEPQEGRTTDHEVRPDEGHNQQE